MTVSIITAVYNRERTIARAVRSVANQTYSAVQHIVIDGNSSDNTLTEISRCEVSGLILVSEPDAGVYDALNKGIRMSDGDVIGVLHSDDCFFDDDVLKLVMSCFSDPSVDIVYGDLLYVSGEVGQNVHRVWRSSRFSRRMLILGWMPPHPTVFVRRRLIDACGSYDKSFSYAGDYEAILRWFSQPGIVSVHLPHFLVKMWIGGISNGSLRKVFRNTREDFRAIRMNNLGGMLTLICKKLRKITQVMSRSIP